MANFDLASTSRGLRAGQLVRHTHQHATHGAQTRHGLVTKVHDPVVVATDRTDPEHPRDVFGTHADVAWFGLDGHTTVPVDTLEPID